MIVYKSDREIALMREAGRVVAEALDAVEQAIAPGVTTARLDQLVEELMLKRGARPAFKGYRGYPASICTSINNEVVHGIPSLKTLSDGDIVSVDIGAEINGYYGDAARTFPVGTLDAISARLIKVTAECLDKGILQCNVNNRLTDISYAIQTHAEENGFSVVKEFVGHGIGRTMHEEPQLPNFGRPGRGPRLTPGLVLAIEPMVNTGGSRTQVLADNWTVVTKDGGRSAHFEHTVAITANGPEILTRL